MVNITISEASGQFKQLYGDIQQDLCQKIQLFVAVLLHLFVSFKRRVPRS